MKKHTALGWVSAAAIALCALSAPAFATPVIQTIALGQTYTGDVPPGSAPWLTATFSYEVDPTTGTTDTGTLVLQSHLSSSAFVQGATGVTGWGFNIGNNTVVDFDCGGTDTCANTVTATPNSASVPGGFNLGFGWTSGNRFEGTDTASYSLSFETAFSTSPFVANGSGWVSYAHVQYSPSCSGFIVSGDGTVSANNGVCGGTTHQVPEPKALGIFGLGILLIGGFLGLRRRYS